MLLFVSCFLSLSLPVNLYFYLNKVRPVSICHSVLPLLYLDGTDESGCSFRQQCQDPLQHDTRRQRHLDYTDKHHRNDRGNYEGHALITRSDNESV